MSSTAFYLIFIPVFAVIALAIGFAVFFAVVDANLNHPETPNEETEETAALADDHNRGNSLLEMERQVAH